jgi:hypothetical protein
VGGGDINGVSLTLAAPVDVKAVTRFTNTPPEPPQGMPRAIRGGACIVNLIRPGKSYTSNWGESGESAVKSVQPGRYRVALRCFGTYVRSAVTGTQDLLANPELTIAPALAPAPVEIVATYGGGQMEGVITAPAGGEEQNIQVLLVPAFTGNTGPQIIPAFQGEGNEFRFQTAGLAPGSYTVYAFLNRDDLEYRNPRFLESLSGGTTVLVEDKAQKSVRLTVTR